MASNSLEDHDVYVSSYEDSENSSEENRTPAAHANCTVNLIKALSCRPTTYPTDPSAQTYPFCKFLEFWCRGQCSYRYGKVHTVTKQAAAQNLSLTSTVVTVCLSHSELSDRDR
jgi:hypothetical protein